jgi:hypothetical protein
MIDVIGRDGYPDRNEIKGGYPGKGNAGNKTSRRHGRHESLCPEIIGLNQ